MNVGIGNVKAKKGGGDAELNIAYGLTPPSDTSKIWVKCDTPSKVKIEANRNLVVSSDENAKLINKETIATTRLPQGSFGVLNPALVKIEDDYYISTLINNTAYFKGNSIAVADVGKYSNETYAILYTASSTRTYGLFKFDNTHLARAYSKNTSPYLAYVDIVNISNGNATTYSTDVARQYFNACCFHNRTLYGIDDATATQNLIFSIYEIGGSTTQKTVSMPSGLYRYQCSVKPVYYNGALYFVLNVGDSNADTNQPKIYKWVIGANEIVEVMTLPYIIKGGIDYSIGIYLPFIFGNKMILTNMSHYYTSADIITPDVNYIYICDLDNATYEKIELEDNYSMAYVWVDENTGDIEIWGGYPSATIGVQKQIIYNIYELEENTLDLYYDIYSSNNIKLIDTPTLTLDCPINHAWLGDSNNIAQSVNMYYYDELTTTWKGINCADYSE